MLPYAALRFLSKRVTVWTFELDRQALGLVGCKRLFERIGLLAMPDQ